MHCPKQQQEMPIGVFSITTNTHRCTVITGSNAASSKEFFTELIQTQPVPQCIATADLRLSCRKYTRWVLTHWVHAMQCVCGTLRKDIMQQPLSAACEVNRAPGASNIAPRYAPAAALAIMAGTAGSAPPDALALRCAGVCVNKVVEGGAPVGAWLPGCLG